MKIVLANNEREAIRDIAGMLGIKKADLNAAVTADIEYGGDKTQITINPDYTVEFIGFIMSIAPMLKGVYEHAKGVFSVVNNLGMTLDAKWAVKPISKEEVL